MKTKFEITNVKVLKSMTDENVVMFIGKLDGKQLPAIIVKKGERIPMKGEALENELLGNRGEYEKLLKKYFAEFFNEYYGEQYTLNEVVMTNYKID